MTGARTNTDALPFTGQPTPAAREREARIRHALRGGPLTAEQVITRTGLPQSVVYAELSLLADLGTLRSITVYALPGEPPQRVTEGR